MAKKLWQSLTQANKGVLAGLLVLGIFLMILPTFWSNNDNSVNGTAFEKQTALGYNPNVSEIQLQEADLSKNAENILGKISGVGKIQVWVSIEKGRGQEKSSGFAEPGQQQVEGAKIRGVVVAAQGASDAGIRWQLYQAVKALFDIPMDAIFVAEGMEELE